MTEKRNNKIYCLQEVPYTRWLLSQGAKLVTKRDIILNTEKFIGSTLVLHGLKSHRVIKKLKELEIDFYYIDTGYFGNYISKTWHRVVLNSMHHSKLSTRPPDRLKLIHQKIYDQYKMPFSEMLRPWKKTGKDILICPPSDKSMKCYNLEPQTWLEEIINELKRHTKRKIKIRIKPPVRSTRISKDSIYSALDDNIFALVTYNSIVAVEAIMYGIPAFTLGENAANPVALTDISKIEDPSYPSDKRRLEWLRHLSYGQFSFEELKSGNAWEILAKMDNKLNLTLNG